MNHVLNVDPIGYAMTVEAGCILQTIQETAASHDRFFPLSLGAQGSCMIGGNLSTNAGGVQVLRFGNARNLVLGVEVVLANGDVWDGLRALKKDNTGYDLKHLFMGAEGTLGIITKAVLKLWPAPKDVCTAWLAIRDPQAAIDILSGAYAASDDNVGSCELLSRASIDMVLRHIPGTQDPLKAETGWYLLLEWSSSRPRQDGGTGMSEKMEQFLADQLEAGRVLDAVIAQTQTQSRNMWRIRESMAEAQRAEGPGLSYDVSVAISRIPEFIDKGLKAVLDILPTIRPYPLGHIGDGNLHFSFMGPKGMDRQTLTQYSDRDRSGRERSHHLHGRFNLGGTWHRHREDRRTRALPVQDRARHHAHDQAGARSKKHHEPRQDPAPLVRFGRINKRGVIQGRSGTSTDASFHHYRRRIRDRRCGRAPAGGRRSVPDVARTGDRRCGARAIENGRHGVSTFRRQGRVAYGRSGQGRHGIGACWRNARCVRPGRCHRARRGLCRSAQFPGLAAERDWSGRSQ